MCASRSDNIGVAQTGVLGNIVKKGISNNHDNVLYVCMEANTGETQHACESK